MDIGNQILRFRLVVDPDKAMGEYYRDWRIDEETGEPVAKCGFRGGPCTACGKCDPECGK